MLEEDGYDLWTFQELVTWIYFKIPEEMDYPLECFCELLGAFGSPALWVSSLSKLDLSVVLSE